MNKNKLTVGLLALTIVVLVGVVFFVYSDSSFLQGKLFGNFSRVVQPQSIQKSKIDRKIPSKILPYKDDKKDIISHALYLKNIDPYFKENKGTLDCSKPANYDFCEIYNSANKYYGLGEYALKYWTNSTAGDLVVIDPFIFKWNVGLFGTRMNVIWVNVNGDPYLIDSFSLNGSVVEPVQGIYVLNDNASQDSQKFVFTADPKSAYNWCEVKGFLKYGCAAKFTAKTPSEVEYSTQNIVGFAEIGESEFNKYLTKSLQNCYEADREFMGISSFLSPVYSRFGEVNVGGGCSSTSSINCGSTESFITNVLSGDMKFSLDGATELSYVDAVNDGICVGSSAEAHELAHVFVYGTPLWGSFILNEGLATYVQRNTAADERGVLCLNDGYRISFDGEKNVFQPQIHPYINLDGDPPHSNEAYTTASCIWDYIDTTYGHDKFVEILKAIEAKRYMVGSFNIFESIINPIAGENVVTALNDAYGFDLQEQVVKKDL